MTKTEKTMNESRERYDSGEFPLSTLRRVAVNRPGHPQEAFALRLPPEVVEELKVLADVRGIGVTQLVREWIVERLQLKRRRPETSDPLLWERTKAVVWRMLPQIAKQVSASSQSTSEV